MKKKLVGVILLAIGSAAGCATSPAGSLARGTVLGSSAGARAIVTGPAIVHAYAGFAGGEVYSTPAATRTDADCAGNQQVGAAVLVPADRVVSITVAAGETACLRTAARGGYELLWHARTQQPTPQLMANVTAGGRP